MADLLLNMKHNPISNMSYGVWITEVLNLTKNDKITILLDLFKYDSYCFIVKTMLINGEILPSVISVVRICKTSSRKLTEFRIDANTYDRNTIKTLLPNRKSFIIDKVEAKFWKSKFHEIDFCEYNLYLPTGNNMIEVSI
jgi:hypothetical protein